MSDEEVPASGRSAANRPREGEPEPSPAEREARDLMAENDECLARLGRHARRRGRRHVATRRFGVVS